MTEQNVEINEELTRRVASLARLQLSPEEVTTFTAQMADIIKYVEILRGVEVGGVAPMSHPLDLETPFREDRVEGFPADPTGRPRVLGSAPEVVSDGYKVPPVL